MGTQLRRILKVSEHPLANFCRIILNQPDIRGDLEKASRELLDAPHDSNRALGLALALFRSSAFGACVQLLASLDVKSLDLNHAKMLLAGVSLNQKGDLQEASRVLGEIESLNPNGQWVSAVLEEIYQTANIAFNRSEMDRARTLYNLGLRFDTRLHGINKGSLGQPLDPIDLDNDVQELLHRLREAESCELSQAEFPPAAQKLASVSEEDINLLKGRKLLLILREQMHENSQSRKCEISHNFLVSAERAGLEVQTFSADPFIFYWLHSDEDRAKALKKLAGMIAEFRPDAVVFDCLCAQVSDITLTPQVYAGTLTKLKQLFGFKLIALYPDAYEPACTWASDYVAQFADSIWILSHLAFLNFSPEAQNKTTIVPYPYPNHGLDFESKDIETAFLGTSKRYNFLRSLWFLAMEDAKIPYELLLTDPTEKPNRLCLSDEAYGELLGRIQTCIQFSARDVTTKIMCGRVWESMMVGCALLEEENIETKELLVPYVHYVPFNDLRELAVAVECLRRYPDARERLATRGYRWVRKLLSGENLWAYMLLKA